MTVREGRNCKSGGEEEQKKRGDMKARNGKDHKEREAKQKRKGNNCWEEHERKKKMELQGPKKREAEGREDQNRCHNECK